MNHSQNYEAPIDVPAILFGAMAYLVLADQNVTAREQEALRAQCNSLPELAGIDLDAVSRRAGPALNQAQAASPEVRMKAFTNAIEVYCASTGGVFGPAEITAMNGLARILGVPEDVASRVLMPLRSKYVAGEVDDAFADTMIEALFAVAAANGQPTQAALTVLARLLATVPQLNVRNANELVARAMPRLGDRAAFMARLSALPRFRDKTFSIATEIAAVDGFTPAAMNVLAALRSALPISEGLDQQAVFTYTCKYASTGQSAAPAPSPLANLVRLGVEEGAKHIAAGVYYFATLLTENAAGEMNVYHASIGFLPQSAQELQAKLATMRDVRRYAIVTPALSPTLGSAVISVDAAGLEASQGEHWEQPYQPATAQAPVSFGALTAQGTCESLLASPARSDALSLAIESSKPGERVYAARLGEARFELRLENLSSMDLGRGAPVQIGRARVVFASASDVALFADTLAAQGAPGLPVAGALAPELTLNASVVVFTERGRWGENGFANEGGSWLVSKWTFETDDGSVEVSVHVQPHMKRAFMSPREGSWAEVAAVFAKQLSRTN